MKKYSDEQLIEIYRTSNGNQKRKAFDCLYVRYSDSVIQYFFFSLYRNLELARDFAHDLFLKVLESPEKFDTSQAFKPWLFRVASNMCKNEFRKQNVVDRFNEYYLQTVNTTSHISEDEIKLNLSIKKLSQEQRSLIVLRFKINLSIREIAEIHGCPEGTIKSRLFYATQELTKLFKMENYEE